MALLIIVNSSNSPFLFSIDFVKTIVIFLFHGVGGVLEESFLYHVATKFSGSRISCVFWLRVSRENLNSNNYFKGMKPEKWEKADIMEMTVEYLEESSAHPDSSELLYILILNFEFLQILSLNFEFSYILSLKVLLSALI